MKGDDFEGMSLILNEATAHLDTPKRYRITWEECDEHGWAPDLGMVMVAADIGDARRQFDAYSPGHFGRRNVRIELESDYFARQAPDHDDDECLQR